MVGEKTDGQKKDEGKTTTNENEEQARVTLQVYKNYLSFVGGYKQLFLTHLALVLFVTSRVISDYLVGSWTISPD